MKTLLTLSVFLICLVTPFDSFSQEKGDIKLSAGFSGMHLDHSLGLAVGAEYVYAKNFSVAANLLYSERGPAYLVSFESFLGIDFRYYFLKKGINAYAFSGYGNHQVQGIRANDFGLRNYHSATFGAGAEYSVGDKLDVYVQSKGWYNAEGAFQTFNLGVIFRLNKKDD